MNFAWVIDKYIDESTEKVLKKLITDPVYTPILWCFLQGFMDSNGHINGDLSFFYDLGAILTSHEKALRETSNYRGPSLTAIWRSLIPIGDKNWYGMFYENWCEILQRKLMNFLCLHSEVVYGLDISWTEFQLAVADSR